MALPPPLKVLLVDDEPLARLRLRSLLEACAEPKVQVVAEAGTTSQAQSWLREHGCDLVLLDVEMPGPSGLQLVDSLRAHPQQPAVVFVTAHAEHALRAYELDAMDYLTKPVRRERLQAALQRVAQRLIERAAAQSLNGAGQAQIEAEFITLIDRGRLLRVPLAEVLYFKAELKYLTLRTAAQSYVMDGSLAELEPRLGARFIRVHRNALVAKAAVRELQRHIPTDASDAEEAAVGDGAEACEGWAVRVASVNEWLTVSRRQVAAVRDALAGNSA